MSIRAYRVIEILLDDASFNLYQDQDLVDFLDSDGLLSDNLSSNGGLVTIPLAKLNRAVKNANRLHIAAETVKRLRQDIAWAKSNNDEVVTYSCF